jgi:hypothetical protein
MVYELGYSLERNLRLDLGRPGCRLPARQGKRLYAGFWPKAMRPV